MVQSLVAVVLACVLFLDQCRSAPFGKEVDHFARIGNLSSIPPSVDPFYRFGDISALHNGQVIAKRTVTSQSFVQSPFLQRTVQVQYRTTMADDRPDATLTTVFVPRHPRQPAEILSAQIFSDSAAVDCAVSWSLILASKSMANSFLNPQTIIVQQALEKDYYVSSADYQGSKAAFNSRAEGRAILDSLRAVLSDKDLVPDSAAARLVLTGYSGGAHATLSAIEQSLTYAPELNIIGASFGGTPVDPKATLNKLNGGDSSYFALAGLVGLMNAYPDLDAFISQHMYENGTRAVNAMRHSCYINSSDKWKGIDVYSLTTLGRQGFFDAPIVQSYLSQEILGQDSEGKAIIITAFPMHIYHASKDPMIPFQPVADFVEKQCAGGASISFHTDKLPNHSGELFKGMHENFKWIKACFAGACSKKHLCSRRDSFL